jgi:hypothetical protein
MLSCCLYTLAVLVHNLVHLLVIHTCMCLIQTFDRWALIDGHCTLLVIRRKCRLKDCGPTTSHAR